MKKLKILVPADFTCATKLEELDRFISSLSGCRLSRECVEQLRLAYRVAKAGHFGQFRDNGAPYFEHVRDTDHILMVELGVTDCSMICAGLLHDTIEDSQIVTPLLIELLFGRNVLKLVQAVTKPKRADSRFKNDRARHQFYFKQLTEAGDQVKLLKLCDRLHNLRTLWQCAPEKRERKVEETKTIYLPFLRDICRQYPAEAKYLRRQFDFYLRGFRLGTVK